MAKSEYQTSISEDEKNDFQRRLSHYLKSYRHRKKITVATVAKELQYSQIRYFALEKETPNGRFITSLDLLARLAKIENLSISEFVSYLEGRGRDRESGQNQKLFKWQESIFNGFESMAIGPRKKFADLCEELGKKNHERLELLVQLLVALKDKDNAGLKALIDAMKKL